VGFSALAPYRRPLTEQREFLEKRQKEISERRASINKPVPFGVRRPSMSELPGEDDDEFDKFMQNIHVAIGNVEGVQFIEFEARDGTEKESWLASLEQFDMMTYVREFSPQPTPALLEAAQLGADALAMYVEVFHEKKKRSLNGFWYSRINGSNYKIRDYDVSTTFQHCLFLLLDHACDIGEDKASSPCPCFSFSDKLPLQALFRDFSPVLPPKTILEN